MRFINGIQDGCLDASKSVNANTIRINSVPLEKGPTCID